MPSFTLPHVDDPARPDSWRARQAQHTAQITGRLSPEEAAELLRLAHWNEEEAKRQATRNEWVIDGNLRLGQGLYYGPHDPQTQRPRIHLSPQYRDYPNTAGHEAEHSIDHERGLHDDFAPFTRELQRLVAAPGASTVMAREAQKALGRNDPGHLTTGIWEGVNRDVTRMNPDLARRYWPFVAAMEQAGQRQHRTILPVVNR